VDDDQECREEAQMAGTTILKTTADVRQKLLNIWKLVEEKKISSSEARLHIGLARAILETLKVEIAVAHLTRSELPAVSLGRNIESLPLGRQ
jgi:hypothetical protein